MTTQLEPRDYNFDPDRVNSWDKLIRVTKLVFKFIIKLKGK